LRKCDLDRRCSCTAAGGVGTQFALLAGAQGTATPAKHDQLRELGAIPLDYRQPHLADRVRQIAPGGVAAVFDHGTGAGLRESWRSLAHSGRLVAYGATSSLDDTSWRFTPFLSMVAKLAWWSVRPGRRRWLPLPEAAKALRMLIDRTIVGKVILLPQPV
jgi:NADPH:quinone reductase-like Zn-dependent oxidoreductase